MAAPSIVQSKELALTQQTGSASVTLNGDCAAGNSLYLRMYAQVSSANASDPVVVTATPSGGSATPMQQIAYQAWGSEPFKRVSVWRLDEVSAATYTIAVSANGSAGDSAIRGFVDEIADAASIETFVANSTYATGNTQNGASQVALGPLPSSGTFAGPEILALAVTAASNGLYSDINWTTPSGWAMRLDQGDGTTGKPPIAILDRALSSSAAISATFASAVPDEYGRAAIIVALVNSGPDTQQRVRIEHGDSSLDGVGGITVEVFANPPAGHTFTGTKLFEVTGLSWANEDIGGGVIRSVLEFDVPDAGDWYTTSVSIATGGTVVVGGGLPGTDPDLMGSAAFVGYAVGEVIEVEV